MKLLLGLLIASVILYLIYNRNQLENFREITKEEICHQDRRLLVVDPPNVPVAPEKYYAVTQDKENIHYPTTLNPAYAKTFKVPKLKYDGIYARHCNMKGVDMEECGWTL